MANVTVAQLTIDDGVVQWEDATIISTAAGNHAVLTFDKPAGGAGDSMIRFQLGSASKFTMGVDDSDSDKFKLARGGDLGTTDVLVVDSSGNVGIGVTPTAKLDVDGSAIFNESGADVNFRIESDNAVHMFNVDGGMNAVGIGAEAIASTAFYINGVQSDMQTDRIAVSTVGLQLMTGGASAKTGNGSGTLAIGVSNASFPAYAWDNASATLTLTNSTTVYIAGPPTAGTNVTMTNAAYSLWVRTGTTQLGSTSQGTATPLTLQGDYDAIMYKKGDGVNVALIGTRADIGGADNITFHGYSGCDWIFNNGNIGIGTTTPFTNVAGGSLDLSVDGAHIKGSSHAQLLIEGSPPSLNMIDTGGGSNDKWMLYRVDGGVGFFISIDDSGSTVSDKILVMDLGSGRVGISSDPSSLYKLMIQQNASSYVSMASATAGVVNVYRNEAASTTAHSVVKIHQDHASDDQTALQVLQDGTGFVADFTGIGPSGWKSTVRIGNSNWANSRTEIGQYSGESEIRMYTSGNVEWLHMGGYASTSVANLDIKGTDDDTNLAFRTKNLSGSTQFSLDNYGQNTTNRYITWGGGGIAVLGSAGKLHLTETATTHGIQVVGTKTGGSTGVRLDETWNAGSAEMLGFYASITNTASSSASSLFRGTVGGSIMFNATVGGGVLVGNYISIRGDDAAGNASSSWPLRLEADTNNIGWISAHSSLYLSSANNIFLYGTSSEVHMQISGTDSYQFDTSGFGSRHTGGVQLAKSGVDGNPKLYFNADTNTGIGHPIADNLSVITGGTERVRFSANGDINTYGGAMHMYDSGSAGLQDASGSRPLVFSVLSNDAQISHYRDLNIKSIDSYGEVGINYASVTQALQVNGRVQAHAYGITDSRTTYAATGSVYGFIFRSGDASGTYPFNSAGNAAVVIQGPSSGGGGDIVFATGNSSPTVKMVIYKGGNIGAPSGSNIYNASDKRLKRNVIGLTDSLSIINQLQGISFNWIEGFSESEKDKTLYGFIAQDVDTVDTNLVEPFGTEENMLTVNDVDIPNALRVNEKFIIPLLVEAIKELKAEIDVLKKRV